jgi:hypothetical protein
VHRAFRRRLREHHPDTRSQNDDATDSASDQALQRALAAYQTLRHRAATSEVEAPTESQPERPENTASGTRSATLGDPPLRATPVRWMGAADAAPSHYARPDRLDHPDPRLDAVIRWLLDR